MRRWRFLARIGNQRRNGLAKLFFQVLHLPDETLHFLFLPRYHVRQLLLCIFEEGDSRFQVNDFLVHYAPPARRTS